MEPVLSRLLLNLILKRRNTLDDLKFLDKQLHRNLVALAQMDNEQLDSMGLSFVYSRIYFGKEIQDELEPNGRFKSVNRENVMAYIHLFANYKCNKLIEKQSAAFLEGLTSIIPLDWLQMFSPKELELVISGSPKGLCSCFL